MKVVLLTRAYVYLFDQQNQRRDLGVEFYDESKDFVKKYSIQ